jgi:hypothetical protein
LALWKIRAQKEEQAAATVGLSDEAPTDVAYLDAELDEHEHKLVISPLMETAGQWSMNRVYTSVDSISWPLSVRRSLALRVHDVMTEMHSSSSDDPPSIDELVNSAIRSSPYDNDARKSQVWMASAQQVSQTRGDPIDALGTQWSTAFK